MDIILQVWGGLFYLTNKICFAIAESKSKTEKTIKNYWLDGLYFCIANHFSRSSSIRNCVEFKFP